MICPKCGKENNDGFKFCKFCGEKFVNNDELDTLENEVDIQNEERICPNCKQTVSPTDYICKYCGEVLKEEKPSSYILCKNCGRYNSIDSEYCSNCGKSLKAKDYIEQQVASKKKPGFALSIVSISLAIVGFFVIFAGQIAAIITGVIALIKSAKALKTKDTKVIIAFVLSICAVVIGVLSLILWIYIVATTDVDLNPYIYEVTPDSDNVNALANMFIK